MPQIRNNPMKLGIFSRVRFENNGSRYNRVKRNFFRRDRLQKIIQLGRISMSFVHDNVFRIGWPQKDVPRL